MSHAIKSSVHSSGEDRCHRDTPATTASPTTLLPPHCKDGDLGVVTPPDEVHTAVPEDPTHNVILQQKQQTRNQFESRKVLPQSANPHDHFPPTRALQKLC